MPISRQVLDIGQKRSGGIARRQLGAIQAPGYANGWIVPSHDNFICRAVQFIALVETISLFVQHKKAMRKALRNQDLRVFVLGILYCHVAAEGRATDAHIDGDVEKTPAQRAN